MKKKLRFLREERLSPHEVKPDGFVDHFFAKKMVGVRGFEPPASASRTQRSSQTEPHPDFESDSAQFLALFYNIIHVKSFFKPFLGKNMRFLLFVLRQC